jgi:hypothetical protein
VREWVAGDEEATHSDRYLAARLAAATADYKGVALTTFLLGAGVGVFVWLGIGILAEHWVVAGGLPRWLRWTWLAAGLVALVAAALRWLVPLMRYRVNLVYAARQIEREHPELHNDLVNTVLVKARPEGSPSVVVTSLKRRTARRLADVAGSTTMDRTSAVRLAYALMAAVGLACLYEVVAPKSLLVSAARLVAPWIGWTAPSRVRIDGPRLAWRLPDEPGAAGAADVRRRMTIDGGRAVVVRGRQVEVTAGIRGLRAGEQPVCRVTPLTDAGAIDPQATPWQVAMHSGPDADPAGRLFTALLPDAARGLDRSLDVSIVGGDAHTEPVRLTVVDAPSLLVREVRYDFPAYTRRQPETLAWQGDLRAVEETLATLSVEANQPLEAAWIDFGCNGQRDLKIKLSGTGGRQGTVSFPLRLNADRLAAEHPTYRLVFQGANAAGARDGVVIDSLVHRIEVLADIAPEVALEEPTDSPRRVPPGSPLLVRVRASDPDFGLARVGIETRIKGGGQVTPIVLLDEPREGVFKGSARLVPDKLGAGPGSVLEYRGFAIDTRPQQSNVAHTPWQELQIDAAAKPQAQPADQPGIPDDPDRGDDRQGDGARDGARDGAAAGRDARGPRDRAGRDGGADEPAAGDRDPRDGREPRQRQSGDDENGGDAGAGEADPRAGGRDRQPAAGRSQPPRRDPSAEPRDQPADQPGEGGGGGDGQQAGDRGAGDARGQQPNQGQNQQGGRGGRQGQPRDGASEGASGQSGDQAGDDGMPAEGSSAGGAGKRQGKPTGGTGGGQSASERDGDRGEQSGAPEGQQDGEGAAGEGDSPADDRAPGAGRQQKGSGRGQGRVAADGTNDGEAMERILEDRQRQGGDDTAADGSRDGAADSGRQREDRQGTDQRRPDRSGRSPEGEGEQAQRSGDSAPGGQDTPAGDESADPTGQDGDPSSATDGGKAGGTSGRKTRPEGGREAGPAEAGQPTNERTGERSGAGEQARQPGDPAGNDAPKRDRDTAGEDRQSDGQRAAQSSGGKSSGGEENGSGRKGDSAGQTEGQPSAEGDDSPGRDPKSAVGRKDAQQRGDNPTDGQKGAGKQGAGEQGGKQGAGQNEGTEKGAGEKGGGEKGGGEKGGGEKGAGQQGGGEKNSDQNQQGGRDQGAGQEGAGQQGGDGQPGGAKGGAKGGGQKGGGQKGGGGQQGDDANGQGADDSPEDQGQPGGEQAGAEQGADESSDAAAGGGKPNGAGNPAGGKQGNASGRQAGPAGQGGGAQDPEGAPPAEGADPVPQQDGNSGKGGWARSDGAADPQQGPVDGQAPTAETEWGQQDVAHARNAADLAIEHLRRSLEKGDRGVLDSLGWTKDDARAFLERWQSLRQQADGGDPVKRRELDRTLRSLGLRGGNVRSTRDVPSDVKGGQAEGRRSRPPSEYRERFKAYTQGTTSE